MALIRVHLHLHLHLPITRFNDFRTPTKLRISCSNSNSNNSSSSSSSSISDTELAMDLELEIEKMKTQVVQTQEAMRRSRKLLYAEMCLFLGLGEEELRRKWERIGEDDKWVLAQEFVSDWGSNFHPLSAKSVKELVDQHLFLDGNIYMGHMSNLPPVYTILRPTTLLKNRTVMNRQMLECSKASKTHWQTSHILAI